MAAPAAKASAKNFFIKPLHELAQKSGRWTKRGEEEAVPERTRDRRSPWPWPVRERAGGTPLFSCAFFRRRNSARTCKYGNGVERSRTRYSCGETGDTDLEAAARA